MNQGEQRIFEATGAAIAAVTPITSTRLDVGKARDLLVIARTSGVLATAAVSLRVDGFTVAAAGSADVLVAANLVTLPGDDGLVMWWIGGITRRYVELVYGRTVADSALDWIIAIASRTPSTIAYPTRHLTSDGLAAQEVFVKAVAV